MPRRLMSDLENVQQPQEHLLPADITLAMSLAQAWQEDYLFRLLYIKRTKSSSANIFAKS